MEATRIAAIGEDWLVRVRLADGRWSDWRGPFDSRAAAETAARRFALRVRRSRRRSSPLNLVAWWRRADRARTFG